MVSVALVWPSSPEQMLSVSYLCRVGSVLPQGGGHVTASGGSPLRRLACQSQVESTQLKTVCEMGLLACPLEQSAVLLYPAIHTTHHCP